MKTKINEFLGYPRYMLQWLPMFGLRRLFDELYVSKHFRRLGTGTITPVESVIRTLHIKGFLTTPVNALEVFGGNGLFKTIDLAKYCDRLEHLEIKPYGVHHAKRVLPRDKTTIRRVDSIKAINNGDLYNQPYNLVHIDNPFGPFGPGYCENFDLFPAVFNYLQNRSVVFFNALLDIREYNPSAEWLDRRRKFFNAPDPKCLTYDNLVSAYVSHVPQDLFIVQDVFPVPHFGGPIYLVLYLRRKQT